MITVNPWVFSRFPISLPGHSGFRCFSSEADLRPILKLKGIYVAINGFNADCTDRAERTRHTFEIKRVGNSIDREG
ncbi:MAG: hypothetical protein JXA49_11150 [Actinobacteria bacterium]|nr:hypothetical protein [Actinomycetota bacterium]